MENILRHIVDEASQRGHDVTVRNVAYALMRVYFNDPTIAYTVINGSAPKQDSDVTDYDSMSSIQYLTHWFKKDLAKDEQKKDDVVAKLMKQQNAKSKAEVAISADENFEGAVEQLKRVQELRERCDPTDIKTLRDLEKMELEIRVKLVDKWDMQKQESDTKIWIGKIYDYLCPWTGRECYQIGKEEAMEKWNLKEKD